MSRLPQSRVGSRIKTKELAIDFSFYPTKKIGRRETIQPRLFASDPWIIMHQSIVDGVSSRKSKSEALSFLAQGISYYEAVQSVRDISARPLLLYYAFMNAVKAFILHRKIRTNLDLTVQHGISEQSGAVKGDLTGAKLRAFQSLVGRNGINLFDDFLKAITGAGLIAQTDYKLQYLIRQMLPGHRLWCTAAGEKERFIHVSDVSFMQIENTKEMWLTLTISKSDLKNTGLSYGQFMQQANMDNDWSIVTSGNSEKIVLQLDSLQRYTRSPLDKLTCLCAEVKNSLWTSVLSHPPYRRYYLHLSKSRELCARLPQLLSIYSVIYYLSSIARYRPYHFDKLLSGRYGSLLNSVLVDQPQQFLFLLASEFACQEVTKAAIV